MSSYVSELASRLFIYSRLEEVLNSSVNTIETNGVNSIEIDFVDKYIGHNKYFKEEMQEVVRKYKKVYYPML